MLPGMIILTLMNSHQLLKHCNNHILFRLMDYAFVALQLRHELAKRSTKQRPFVLWLTNLLVTYAGEILVNMLLGTLPLKPLSNVQDILLCSAAWYLIFYSPFDCAHSLACSVLFRLLAAPVTAISQILHIERGVQLAVKMYGNNAMVPILIVGTVIGSGAEFLKPVAALFINRCQLNNAAYVKLSTNSKVSLGITWLFLLQLNKSRLLLGLGKNQLQLYVLFMLMCFKYMVLFYRIDHLIWRMENRLSYALFGGHYTDFNKFFKRRPKSF
ncbi:trimeric intracellular cation channel type 1B.2 isoform X1 [Drosophila grimshawi]|uniref:trimeric intracellular cation channel type 1B.2 isoform X1 n=1 Tax=Drosophila grimshawi TaxID=7222 RepID=UPI000C86E9C2|nr:trimeric intracellular cation channel type 1B.2 isoform X1 [Drosophila grimshawi]